MFQKKARVNTLNIYISVYIYIFVFEKKIFLFGEWFHTPTDYNYLNPTICAPIINQSMPNVPLLASLVGT